MTFGPSLLPPLKKDYYYECRLVHATAHIVSLRTAQLVLSFHTGFRGELRLVGLPAKHL